MTDIKNNFICLLTVFLMSLLITSSPAESQVRSYFLDDIELGRQNPINFQLNYNCFARNEVSGAFQCTLKQRGSRNSLNADMIIATRDGTILHAQKSDRVAGSLDQVSNTTISQISRELGGAQPTILSGWKVTVAMWGETRLEEFHSYTTEYQGISDLLELDHGLLVISDENLDTTKRDRSPIYRVTGGDGLVAVFFDQEDGAVLVQRFVASAGTLSELNFEAQARAFLLSDQTNPPDDYSRWYEVAFMIRRLALNTSPERANALVDRTFGVADNKKYHSRVWALTPTSVLNHLHQMAYRAVDIFGENTEFPEIRALIIQQLEANPNEPYSEFLLYTLGRFEQAVEFNIDSPIQSVLLYAQAHSRLRELMSQLVDEIALGGDRELLESSIQDFSFRENEYYDEPYQAETADDLNRRLAKKDFFFGSAYEGIPSSKDEYNDLVPTLTQYLNYLNKFPERHGSKPFNLTMREFIDATEPLLPIFAKVARDRNSTHTDDAAYYLAWLTYHRGEITKALDMFGEVVALQYGDATGPGFVNYDYANIALTQINRIFRTLPPRDVFNHITDSDVLVNQPIVWETVLTSLYQSHRHQVVMDGARVALQNFGAQIDTFPVTTDNRRIWDEISKLDLDNNEGLAEFVYLHNASREILEMEDMLKNYLNYSSSDIEVRIKELILKFALTSDADLNELNSDRSLKPRHRDIRQSLYLIRRSLDLLPRSDDLSKFRQWLHYNRIQLLAEFDPVAVPEANSDFEDEFPNSDLLDDGLAEQVFAQAVIIGDLNRATGTFETIQRRFPNENAMDNALSWMAIGWTCVGRPAKAREFNDRIIRNFPLTRHARYARERIETPQNCYGLNYSWDYRAMQWREKTRIDAIQIALGSREASKLQRPAIRQVTIPSATLQAPFSESEAVGKVSDVLMLQMMPGRQGIEKLRGVYAATVDYFGNMTSHAEVIRDKERYFDRWPKRTFELQRETIVVSCANTQACDVSGVFSWTVENAERGQEAAGTASFEFSISSQKPHRVLKETSKVINRQ